VRRATRRIGSFPLLKLCNLTGHWAKNPNMLHNHALAKSIADAAWGLLIPYSTYKAADPRSRSQVEPCDFCVRRGIFSRLGGKDGHKCPFKDSNVVTLMLTTPWRVSGGHPLLTLFDQNPPPIGIATLACGLGYSTLRKKIPRVHLVPLNVGQTLVGQ
jgi:hypothetical protein